MDYILIYIYQWDDSEADYSLTGVDGGHSGTPQTKVGSDQRAMRFITCA